MHRRSFLIRLPLTGLALSLGACVHRHCREAPAESSLTGLIVERLLIAREVAVSKHHSGAPVHDPAREAAILAGLVAQGRERGFDPVLVESFFHAQIAASRRVQEELLAAWNSDGKRPDHPPPDLNRELRPRLDALTPRLLDALSAPRPRNLVPLTARALDSAGFSAEVIALATAPLRP